MSDDYAVALLHKLDAIHITLICIVLVLAAQNFIIAFKKP
jgi:hypothetical protein